MDWAVSKDKYVSTQSGTASGTQSFLLFVTCVQLTELFKCEADCDLCVAGSKKEQNVNLKEAEALEEEDEPPKKK